MCHLVTWYFAMCQHQDQDATSLIACHEAFKKGYDCTKEHQITTHFPLEGSCLQCRLDQLMRRQSISRELRIQRRWSAICEAFQYSDEDGWSISDSDAEGLDMQTRISQSSSFTRRAENRETRASFHRVPSRIPILVQPPSPHLSHVAVVEYADDYAGHKEESSPEPLQGPPSLRRTEAGGLGFQFLLDPLLRTSKSKRYHRTWRSWIPLPVRKVLGQ
ncbi:hypothetical protein N7463_005052 [Penicillium fimorum]|uniref:Uncharacterized protein n=1 Tax=Penicillium fimorum TaxID=1882269 RepID=A0A9W9XRU1_9EURO|nr:hypothetical protein N7463_005052 [Penicillium fimorum]